MGYSDYVNAPVHVRQSSTCSIPNNLQNETLEREQMPGQRGRNSPVYPDCEPGKFAAARSGKGETLRVVPESLFMGARSARADTGARLRCACTPSCSYKGFGYEQSQRQRHGQVETVHAKLPRRSGTRCGVHSFDRQPRLDHSFTQRAEGIICAMSGLGDAAQGGLVQSAAHDFAFAIAHQLGPALFIDHLDFPARRRADPHCEYDYTLLCQVGRDAHPALFEVLAIGEQQHELLPFALFNGVKSFLQGAANIGSQHGDGLVVYDLKRLLESAVIEGERALQECLAGEGDQSNAPVRVALDEIEDGQFRALQAARSDVGGQHTARTVKEEEDVLAQRVADVRLLTPLRACHSQAEACNGQQQHRLLEYASARAVRTREPVEELR